MANTDIHDFELFHGAVLTKIMRSDQPVALRMIETNTKEAWSAYIINDEVTLYVKYSTKPMPRERESGAFVWTFSFTPDQLAELRKLGQEHFVYVALVCGQRDIAKGSMHVSFMEQAEIDECIDLMDEVQQNVFVKFVPGGKLRVWGPRNSSRNPIKVTRSGLEKWKIPGS